MTPAEDRPPAERWLLLIHQLPARPAYLRVKVWRRLQALGAAAVKNAVYALPEGERAREDFAWLLREIASGGGEAFVCEARMVDGLTDREVRALFDGARRRLRGAGQAGARPRRHAGRGAGGRAARRGARAARAAEGAARPGRRDRLLRRPREPGGRGPAGRPGAPAARGRAGRARGTGRRPGPAARADLGDAPGRPRRPHRLGVAGPPLRRPGGDLQVRAGQGLRARAGRAALRHVRRRVHPRGRPLHLRGAPGPGRAGRPGAARHRRAGPRPRPQGRPVRPPRDGGPRRPGRGPLRRHRRRPGAAGAGRRAARRPPRLLPQETAMIRTSAIRQGAIEPAAPRPHGIPFAEAVRTWARVAALSFGGPAGQIAVMHRILVEEKRWIGENRFLHALNYCMLLPGPEAQQLAVYVGWLLHRTAGGLVAGTLFVLPGYVALMVLSLVYAAFGQV